MSAGGICDGDVTNLCSQTDGTVPIISYHTQRERWAESEAMRKTYERTAEKNNNKINNNNNNIFFLPLLTKCVIAAQRAHHKTNGRVRFCKFFGPDYTCFCFVFFSFRIVCDPAIRMSLHSNGIIRGLIIETDRRLFNIFFFFFFFFLRTRNWKQ